MTPKEYKYTKEHEWFCPEPGNRGKIGITDYAQSALGDIVFLNLPAAGTQLQQSKKMGEVESVKAVSDLFSPVSGKVLEINQSAVSDPKLLNDDPYGKGWLLRVEVSRPAELDNLMDAGAYDKLVAEITQGNKG